MRFSIPTSIALIFIISIISLTTSCKHDIISDTSGVTPTDTTNNNSNNNNNSSASSTSGWKCSPDTSYFQYDVLPILVSKCGISGCHDAGTKADGYQFTDYATSVKKGVSAGKASSSKIYTEITKGSMPPSGSGITMTQSQKDAIAKWINQGAKNLNCNPNFGTCDTVNIKYSTFVSPLVQNKCQGCHTSTAPLLTNYTQVKASVQTGKFWGSITHASGYSGMPKGSNKLADCELNKINAWIKAGALNN